MPGVCKSRLSQSSHAYTALMRANQLKTTVHHLPCFLCAHLFSIIYPTSLTLVTEGYQHVLLRVKGQVTDGLGVSIDHFPLLLCHLSRLGIHCVQSDREDVGVVICCRHTHTSPQHNFTSTILHVSPFSSYAHKFYKIASSSHS